MNLTTIRLLSVFLFLSWTLSAQAQSVTRGPYLQIQTDSSIVVRWRTDVATDSVVRYGLSDAALNSTASVSGSRTEHTVQLNALSSATDYFYSVGNSGGPLAGDASYHFNTSPVPGTAAETRIWVVGDSGTADANARSVRDAYKSWSSSWPANFMMMLGDNAYNNGTQTEYQAAVFDIYPELLRQLPVWPTLGNHDGHSADSATQSGPYYDIFDLPKLAEAGGIPSGTEAYYSFDYGNIHFICLDSYETDRSVGGNMLQWLESDLASNDKPWLIAFFHHPPYTKGSHNSDTESNLVDMRQNALPILESWGVDLVLSGHSHSYERSYLLDGHYGLSTTLDPVTNVLDPGDGDDTGDGAYEKTDVVAAANEGSVYAVAGSSGKISGGSLNHPAMYVSINFLGSMVLDVVGNRLNAVFIDNGGVIRDDFTLVKTPDFVAPIVTGARAEDSTHVLLDFFEPVDPVSASTAANFSIAGLTVTGAALLAGTKTVQLTTSAMTHGASYVAEINNLMDEHGNAILPNTQVSFDFNQQVTVSFQDGVLPTSAYDGTSDSYIREATSTTNYGAATTLQVDGDEPSGSGWDMNIVLAWNISDIPTTATVDAASIYLNTLNVGGPYGCYELLRAWNQAEVTWNLAAAGSSWGSPGASNGTDRDNISVCSVDAASTGTLKVDLNSNGIAMVQAWVDGSQSNNGIVIADSVSNNGADFTSSDSSQTTNRPRLEVVYRMPVIPPNQPPAASFGYSCTGLDCSFTDTSVDSDGSVTGWAWDFGDGNSSTAQNPNHSFTSGGTYTVNLVVTDNEGATDSDNQQVSVVAPNLAPVAGFSFNCVDLDCTFTDTSTDSDGTVTGWNWNFGDGNGSSSQSPNHSFAADGTYSVSLTATDNDGASDIASSNVTVSLTTGGGTLEIMSWVPVYAIPQSQAAAQADFGACDAVDGLTRVGLQFWTPNSNGTIKYANHEFYTPVDADVNWWKAWGAGNGIEIFLTIYNNDGTWNWPLARDAFATNRATFVAALVAEMDRLGLDGIDLDLEGIDGSIIASDRANFDQFVHDLWLETSARGKGLTINSYPYIWNAPNQDWWGDWVGEVDNIHSMGYENLYEGGTSWNQYSFQQNTGIAAGYSAETVSMGMPTWMASWGTSSGRGTSAQAHVQEVRYDLAQPTGIALWDMQLTAWQDSNLWCEIQILKNSGVAPAPDAPSGMSAQTFSGSEIRLSWSDNSGDEDGFKVERSPDGSGSWAEVAALAADSTAYADTGLAANTSYFYRVFAHNGNGNSTYSNTDGATTFTIPRTIQFSGRSWTVKSSGSPVGPGPNLFGDTADDVWLDGSGNLHMRIEFRDGNWHSSEVVGDDVLGYGTYTFTLGSRVDLLDRNTVVGLFTWDSSAPAFNYREIDIEFSRWGDPLNDNSQYVVQPWDTAGNTLRWETALTGSDSTHAFTWRPDSVDFSSFQGSPPAAQIQSWSYTGPDVPPEGTTSGNARINFWLMGGNAPFDGQEAELVIKSFDYTPLPANNPPTASFTYSCTELDCNFTDTSSDSDGTISGWAWDFGDGNASTGQNPSHSFMAAGTYPVELTVTDNEGATGVFSTSVTVSVTPAWVDVTANSDIFGSGSVSGTFTDTQTDNGSAQSVTERESGGKKSNRYSYLVHTWQFDVPVNAMATLYANAWSGGSSDDEFAFSWSTDNSSYTSMFNVSLTGTGNNESYLFPASTSGTVYVRVTDTDQTPGNRNRDTVFIDHMYIRAESGAGDPPDAPSALSASSGGPNSINLAWVDNAVDEAGFRIERSTDGSSFTEIGSTPTDDVTFTDTGLAASTTYFYRVLAWNASGDSAWSNTDSATTDAPPPPPVAPSGLLATTTGANSIDLAWLDNSSNETGFEIQRSTDGSTFSFAGSASANATTFSDSGLSAATTYWYRVRAANGSGNSAWSNISSDTTESGPDITLSLNGRKVRGKHEVDLSWSGTSPGTSNVDIFRDGALVYTVPDTGAYTDQTGNNGGRTYDYQVCEAGTASCSPVVSISY